MLASWHEAKQRYLRQHAGPSDLTFSIDLSTTHSQFRMSRGKGLLRTIRLDDIDLFISTTFAASIFLPLGHVYRQTRGATIGNQLSPALCALAIARREQIWTDSFQQFLHSQRLVASWPMLTLTTCTWTADTAACHTGGMESAGETGRRHWQQAHSSSRARWKLGQGAQHAGKPQAGVLLLSGLYKL